MLNGPLTYEDYINLIENNFILSKNISTEQIQPSSIDLTLSNECYQINASFLAINCNVRKILKETKARKIDISKKYIFKKNKTFIVKLNEKLKLSSSISGMCNPKSSTGRLDIFCRTILNKTDEYEKIPKKYKGEMFIEITSRSFDIEFQANDSLNQMRLVFNQSNYIKDSNLMKYHNKNFLTLDKNNKKLMPNISNGLKISVDLSKNNEINAYVAKENAPVLCYDNIKAHKIRDFWKPLKCRDNSIIIQKNKFYILKSKEKIQIPSNMAGEMVPYDTSLGDFRVHYAGFFDPGFGKDFGSYAVLEVKTNEIPFILKDGQVIARIKYEKLNKKSKILYGANINSNYQHQKLALSKHFV